MEAHFVQFSAFTKVGAPFGAPLPLQSFFGFYTVFGTNRIGSCLAKASSQEPMAELGLRPGVLRTAGEDRGGERELRDGGSTPGRVQQSEEGTRNAPGTAILDRISARP